MAGRSCGDCTACCTRLVIPELDKPFGQPCQCLRRSPDPPGCRIYERRPETCSGYSCLWLAEGSPEILRRLSKGQRRRFQPQLQDDDRPDRLGVLFDYAVANGRSMLAAREVRRGAFNDRRVQDVMARLRQANQIVVQVADPEDDLFT